VRMIDIRKDISPISFITIYYHNL